jgi:cyanophycinase
MSAAEGTPRRRASDPAAKKPSSHNGTLILIGGNEDKQSQKVLLHEIATRTAGGKLIIATTASEIPQESFEVYRDIFAEMGATEIEHLHITSRESTFVGKHLETLRGAKGIFFTGGDQAILTSKIGGTPIFREVEKLYQSGGVVAGTSAGAAVMSAVMITAGVGDEAHSHKDAFITMPGLGFLPDVMIDQHFAQRKRLMRLLGAVAQNPHFLGIGIDEDTGVVVKNDCFHVAGSGSVYVLDAAEMTATNADDSKNAPLSLYNMKLHVLNCKDQFCLLTRRPVNQQSRRN